MSLGDILNSINFDKNDLFGDNEEVMNKAYVPFVINRSLSYHVDGVLLANEMNKHTHIDKRMQYDFYRHALSKGKRFSKWYKSENDDDLALLAKHYRCSRVKAEEIKKTLNDSQIESIRQHLKGMSD